MGLLLGDAEIEKRKSALAELLSAMSPPPRALSPRSAIILRICPARRTARSLRSVAALDCADIEREPRIHLCLS